MPHQAHAQTSGINLLFEYRGPNVRTDGTGRIDVGYGLSFQHDFKRRIGMGITGLISGDSDLGIEVLYDSKFFVADNQDGTSGYIGSFIGYQSLRYSAGPVELTRGQVPIGLQVGVRGGLPGYFAEVKVKVGYNLGNGELDVEGTSSEVSTAPLYWGVGISYLGIGWSHKR